MALLCAPSETTMLDNMASRASLVDNSADEMDIMWNWTLEAASLTFD